MVSEWPLIAQIPIFLLLGTFMGFFFAFIPALCFAMDAMDAMDAVDAMDHDFKGKVTIGVYIGWFITVALFIGGYVFVGLLTWTDIIS